MLKLSRSGITTLKRQYKSVLMKCLLINAGILLSAGVASAEVYVASTATNGEAAPATTNTKIYTAAELAPTLSQVPTNTSTITNILSGAATVGKAATLDGLTASVAELNYVDGVTSNIQDQLDNKQTKLTTSELAAVDSGITAADVAQISTNQSNINKIINGTQVVAEATHAVSANSATTLTGLTASVGELNYVDGVTSNIQDQLDNKQTKLTASELAAVGSGITAADVTQISTNESNIAKIISGTQAVGEATHAASATSANTLAGLTASVGELNYVNGVTSNIQDQLDAKAAASDVTALQSTVGNASSGLVKDVADLKNNTAGYQTASDVSGAITASLTGTGAGTIGKAITDATAGMLTSTNYASTLDSVYAKSADLPTKTSDLTNDSGYVTLDAVITDAANTTGTHLGATIKGTKVDNATTADGLTGVTATAAEINKLSGLTASTSELNKLTGVTATTAEMNYLSGVTSNIQTQLDGKTALSDVITDANNTASGHLGAVIKGTKVDNATTADGLTGVTATTAELNKLSGLTASTSELNKLTGVTATTAELNTLSGLTATTAELNILDGVTATTAQINYLSNVTSDVQNQLDSKTSLDAVVTDAANMTAGHLGAAIKGTKVDNATSADSAKAVTSDAIDGSTIVLNGSGKLAVGSITSAKVSDFDAQVNADIATSVASGAIKTALDTKQDNLVIASGSGLSMASDGKTLSVSGVTSAMIENGTIKGEDIGNQTITGNNLVNKTITATQIADNTITADQIAANAVTASELADNAVDTAAIQGNAVTLAKLNADVYTGTATASSAQLMTSGGVYDITNVAAGNYIAAGTNVAGNLTALDTAIGGKIGSDGNFIKASTTNSVNSNILALDGAIGDLSGFASQNYAKNTSNVAANITALDGALKSTNDILGTAETAAISPTSLVTGKIGSEVTVVNALRTVADNAAGLHLNNTFDGANTFKNNAGITIQDTAGTNSASLTATAINFTDISGTGPSSVTDVLKVDTGMLVDDRVATTQGFSIVNNTSGSNYTEVFNIDANGHITSDVLTTTATGVTLGATTGTNSILGTKTTIAGTTEVATLKFAGDETATAIDSGADAKTSASTGNATTLATVASVLKSAENATFTASGAAASNITANTTLNEAIDTLDAKMGKVASVDVNGYETADASKRTLEGAVSALNDNMEAVIGGAYKTNGSYDNSVFEATTPNGFETGATSLTDALTKYADNVLAATGVAYGADGAVATTYTKATSTDYDGLTANSSLKAAIEQLDGNIGTAITGTTRSVSGGTTAATATVNANIKALDAAIGGDVSGAKGNIAKTNTVNQNLDAIDVAIGDRAYKNDVAVNYAAVTTGADVTAAISQVASNIGTATTTGYNGVAAGQTVNANIDAVNAQIGDWANLNKTYTPGASTGNAITNGGDNVPATVVAALNNIDATLGTIHGLSTKLEGNGSYYGNLASGTTVEQHLSALDTAIGDRARFNNMHYAQGSQSVVDAIEKLDTGLNDLDHEVRRLRHHFEGGMASAAALSALQPNARATGDTQLAIGTGAYRGHGAMAIGGYHWFTDNLLVNVGVAHDNREATYRMGVTYSW